MLIHAHVTTTDAAQMSDISSKEKVALQKLVQQLEQQYAALEQQAIMIKVSVARSCSPLPRSP